MIVHHKVLHKGGDRHKKGGKGGGRGGVIEVGRQGILFITDGTLSIKLQ